MALLDEVEEHDLPIKWMRLYEKYPHLSRFEEAIEAIIGGESCEVLFDCFGDDAIVTREPWCGGGPGLSGVWIEVKIRNSALSGVHSAISEIASALEKYFEAAPTDRGSAVAGARMRPKKPPQKRHQPKSELASREESEEEIQAWNRHRQQQRPSKEQASPAKVVPFPKGVRRG